MTKHWRPTLFAASALTAAAVVTAVPVRAHHGAAAYDLATPTTLAATVTAFDWRNPHGLIHFTVADERGATQAWTAETAGLIILNRAGWTRNSLTAGDHITLVGFRAKNGSGSLILRRVVLADGRELNNFVPR